MYSRLGFFLDHASEGLSFATGKESEWFMSFATGKEYEW